MFYDIFKKLCEDNGITPTKASREIGISKGSVSYWKKRYMSGKDAKPDSYTADKIADYFGVSIDYLLGRTSDPIDYDNPDLIAGLRDSVLDHFDGDVRKAYAFQQVEKEDALRDCANHAALQKASAFEGKYKQLDDIDKARVESYVDGLLTADKYQTSVSAKDA